MSRSSGHGARAPAPRALAAVARRALTLVMRPGSLRIAFALAGALLVFNLISLLGYGIVILFPTWQAVIVGAIFFISWTAISLPATMDLVAAALPSNKRTMGVSVHSLVRRVPMALGPIVGGIFVDQFGKVTGVRLAFVCALAMAQSNVLVVEAEGECRGIIADEPRGDGGFGYDPVFLVPELSRTFAELDADVKNRMSHRFRAVAALMAKLR